MASNEAQPVLYKHPKQLRVVTASPIVIANHPIAETNPNDFQNSQSFKITLQRLDKHSFLLMELRQSSRFCEMGSNFLEELE